MMAETGQKKPSDPLLRQQRKNQKLEELYELDRMAQCLDVPKEKILHASKWLLPGMKRSAFFAEPGARSDSHIIKNILPAMQKS